MSIHKNVAGVDRGVASEVKAIDGLADVLRKKVKRKKIVYLSIWIGIFFAIFIVFNFNAIVLFFEMFTFAIVASNVLKTSLTKKEYHKLIESEKNNYKHFCVFCGGTGVHRTHVYRNRQLNCRCSSCQNILYYEMD